MINKLFEVLYNKILVNIVVKYTSSDVYIEVLSKSKIIEHTQKNFKTTTLNEAMLAFIHSYTKESPFSYLSILNMSEEQGALSGCDKKILAQNIDCNILEYKCYKNQWAHYSSRVALHDIQKRYKEVGVDYIFSPYSILANFFKEKIGSYCAMFILVEDSYLSLAIYENDELLFAKHLDIQTGVEKDEELLSQEMLDDANLALNNHDGIDLEDIDVLDDVESLDDIDEFGDIEDLDSLEEIDEFSQNQDLEEAFYEVDEKTLPKNSNDGENFNEDYQRFSLIQSSLGHYYSDEKYDSKFVESVYVADGIGLSDDLRRYLEEEMFLNVYIRKMSICTEVAELAKMELVL